MQVQNSKDVVKRNHYNFLVAKLLVTTMEWLLARVKPYVDVKYHSLYLSNERLFTETFPNKSID